MLPESAHLKQLLDDAKRILVVSHHSPDPDAIASSLFTYSILKENLSQKAIAINIEGSLPLKFNFMHDFIEISDKPLLEVLNTFNPDLLIMTDGNNYGRFTLHDEKAVEEFVRIHNVKTAIIDHHELENRSPADVFINTKCSACAIEVYKVFVEELSFPIYKHFQDVLMIGIIGDTGRFLYEEENYHETYRIVPKLIEAGANIENLHNRIDRYRPETLKIISELLRNTTVTEGFTYALIRDDFMKHEVIGKIAPDIFSEACHQFMHLFLKKTANNYWGFIIYKNHLESEQNKYRGSFRAQNGVIDTTVFSEAMNGGGHKGASVFNVEAPDVQQALNKVLGVIKEKLEEAKQFAHA